MVFINLKHLKIVFVLLFLGTVTSCNREKPLGDEIDKLGRATGPVSKSAWQTDPIKGATGKVHTGIVLDTIDVPNYTYIKLDAGSGRKIWTAVPSTKVQVGQTVRVIESLVMRDFESPTLKRKFDSVIFGILSREGVEGSGKDAGANAPELPPGHPPIGGAAN